MPRWPKDDKPETEQEEAPALLSPAENALHDKVDHLIALVEHLSTKAPDLHEEMDTSHEPTKLQRRRTEDEMRYALRVFANGLPRQRDDDCEAVINDTIGEVLSLRQITMDLMQVMATAHQSGLAAIRKMTER